MTAVHLHLITKLTDENRSIRPKVPGFSIFLCTPDGYRRVEILLLRSCRNFVLGYISVTFLMAEAIHSKPWASIRCCDAK